MTVNARMSLSGNAHATTEQAAPEERGSTFAIPRDAAELEGPLTLRQGAVIYRRAIRADDAQRLRAFHAQLSSQAVVFRFFGGLSELSDDMAVRLSNVDYVNRMAIVATAGPGADEPIIAVVRYQRTEPEVAEIALAVEDRWQRQSISTQLLWALAAYACRRGITTFVAEVMYENDCMLGLLHNSGFPTTLSMHEGHIIGRLDISGLDAGEPAAQR